MGKKEDKKSKGSHLDNLVNTAFSEGINQLVKDNPVFANAKDYLSGHIDQRELSNKIEYFKLNTTKEAKERGLSNYEAQKQLSDSIFDYVSKGKMLDPEGQEIILKYGLKLNEEEPKKNLFQRVFSKPKTDLGKTIVAFNKVYTLLKSGNYSKEMHELEKPLETLNDMGFLKPSLDILKKYDIIKEGKYNHLNKLADKKIKYHTKNVLGALEQKIAASIFLIFGVALLAVTGVNLTHITGNAIGSVSPATSGIISIILIFISLLLFFLFRRHSK